MTIRGTACGKVDNVLDVVEEVRRSPLVADAVPMATVIAGLRTRSDQPWSPTIQYALFGEWPGLVGAPVVVSGRVPDNDAADEAALNETLAEQLGVGVGDLLEAGSYLSDQRLDAVSNGDVQPGGDVVRLRVVGIIRSVDDLSAEPESVLLTTVGWWRQHGGDDVASYGKGAAVRAARPGPWVASINPFALPCRTACSTSRRWERRWSRRVG